MDNSPQIISRRSIGDIIQNGGLSKVVRAAEEGLITVIYRQNEPVAILMACDREREQLFVDSTIIKTLAYTARDKSYSGMMYSHLVNMVEVGVSASKLLREMVNMDEAMNAKHIERERQMLEIARKHSVQEVGSVSPMTTNRGTVSTVKQQEESVTTDSSLPRKRGRPRSVIR